METVGTNRGLPVEKQRRKLLGFCVTVLLASTSLIGPDTISFSVMVIPVLTQDKRLVRHNTSHACKQGFPVLTETQTRSSHSVIRMTTARTVRAH